MKFLCKHDRDQWEFVAKFYGEQIFSGGKLPRGTD